MTHRKWCRRASVSAKWISRKACAKGACEPSKRSLRGRECLISSAGTLFRAYVPDAVSNKKAHPFFDAVASLKWQHAFCSSRVSLPFGVDTHVTGRFPAPSAWCKNTAIPETQYPQACLTDALQFRRKTVQPEICHQQCSSQAW